MESPVIAQKCSDFAMPVDTEETGYPFDDSDYDRNGHIQSRLNNLAQRHPEFATHLRFDDFPSLRRKRHGSGSSADQDDLRHFTANSPGAGVGPSTSRFGDHHGFPSGFNRFPFTSSFEDDFVSEPRREDKPPEVPKPQDKRGRKANPYLPQHLSNTVDLGQKQPPVEENRSQRSMSAPPENRTTHSAARTDNEPAQGHSQGQPRQQEEPAMGKTFSRSRENTPTQPKERIIPIQVEGRDKPVIPKNTNINPSGSAEKLFGNERPHSYQQARQPEASPHQFSYVPQNVYERFMPKGPTQKQPFKQAPPAGFQQAPPGYQQATPGYQPAPPTAHQQAPPAQQAPPPPTQPSRDRQTPPPMSNDPLDKIKCIRSDVMALMNNVGTFRGTRKDREYLYLDEMLTRNLLKLDDIETEGKENIRMARKEAIKCIQTCINNLEARAQAKEKEIKNAEAAGVKVEPSEPCTELVLAEPAPPVAATEPVKYKSQASIVIGPPKPALEPAVLVLAEPTTVESQSTNEKMEVESIVPAPVEPAPEATPPVSIAAGDPTPVAPMDVVIALEAPKPSEVAAPGATAVVAPESSQPASTEPTPK